MKRLTYLFIFCFFAVSARGESEQKLTDNPAITKIDTGTLVIYRPKRFANSAGSPQIKINDKLVGKLKNGRYIELQLPPGDYQVLPVRSIFWWNLYCGSVSANIKSNSKTYVRMDSSASISNVTIINGTAVYADGNHTCSTTIVTEEEALLETQKLKSSTTK